MQKPRPNSTSKAAKKKLDFSSEVERFNQLTISQTEYSQLFRVNRAAQTTETNITTLKKLFYELNLLILDIHDIQKAVQSVYTRDISFLKTQFKEYSQQQCARIQSNLSEKQKIVHAASRTEFANQLCKISREYEKLINAHIKTQELKFSKEIGGLKEQVREVKRMIVLKRVKIDKCLAGIAKMAVSARREFDLQAKLKDERSPDMIELEKLQSTLRSKEQQLQNLEIAVEEQRVQYEAEMAKQPKVKPTIKKQELQVPQMLQKRGSFVQRRASFLGVPNPTRRLSLIAKAQLDHLQAEYSAKQDEELRLDKELEERYQFLFDELKREVCSSSLGGGDVEKVLELGKKIFPQITKVRDAGCQCDEEEEYTDSLPS